jgi:hypothetical protein
MKRISEKSGLARLSKLSDDYRGLIRDRYEHRAKSCITCTTPGACCLDEHFVNVRVSRLEAAAIRQTLNKLEPRHRAKITARIEAAVEKYGLEDSELSKTYACPLYERGHGCLVHLSAKPVACITHACYENETDLPPEYVQFEQEQKVDRVNDLVYGRGHKQLPLPLAVLTSSRSG